MQIIHIGPASYAYEEYKGKYTSVVGCYPNTVLFDAGMPPVDPNASRPIKLLKELKDLLVGTVVSKLLLLMEVK